MHGAQRFGFWFLVSGFSFLVSGFWFLVCGFWFVSGSASAEPAGPDWHLPAGQEEVVRSLAGVARRFGPDAVLMQAYLLNEASRNGSILEAAVQAPKVEERAGAKHVTFVLDSGIVFNDRFLTSAAARVGLVWREIVERCLRRYSTLTIPGDGIGMLIRYHHKGYQSETELREHLQTDGRGEPEAIAFYFSIANVAELLSKKLSAQELLDKSEVLLNDKPYVLRLPAEGSTEY